MNLTQIRAVYESRLQEKLVHAFDVIDRTMINCYRNIEKGEDLTISDFSMNRSSEFPDDYFVDLVKGIISHYSENWDIKHMPETRKEKKSFIFHYIGHPAGYASEIVHRGTIIVEKDEPIINRTQILDLSE